MSSGRRKPGSIRVFRGPAGPRKRSVCAPCAGLGSRAIAGRRDPGRRAWDGPAVGRIPRDRPAGRRPDPMRSGRIAGSLTGGIAAGIGARGRQGCRRFLAARGGFPARERSRIRGWVLGRIECGRPLRGPLCACFCGRMGRIPPDSAILGGFGRIPGIRPDSAAADRGGGIERWSPWSAGHAGLGNIWRASEDLARRGRVAGGAGSRAGSAGSRRERSDSGVGCAADVASLGIE